MACNYGPPDIWKGVIPQRGTVSFDYVSTSRPPADSTAISECRHYGCPACRTEEHGAGAHWLGSCAAPSAAMLLMLWLTRGAASTPQATRS